MNEIKNKAVKFLDKYGMDFLNIDFEKNVEAFLGEMNRGLAGEKSSLDMIPTYIEAGQSIPVNSPVIVIDAGGTNFRTAKVSFNEKFEPVIENLQKYPMPGTAGKVNKEQFYKMMADYVKPIANASENVGFCFSYPSEILPSKDGKPLRCTKEVDAEGIVGELIGENLNAAGGYKKNVIVINDTVAALLAGVGFAGRCFDGYLGFILGTGTNCGYVEKNCSITKTAGIDKNKSMVINVESANFSKCQCGKIDEQFDKTTANPGEHKFEKMMAGVYLGTVILLTIKQAAIDGLFAKPVCRAVEKLDVLETKDVNDFLYYPYGKNLLAVIAADGSSGDAEFLYHICSRLTERAAKLAAINLSAAAVKSENGFLPSKPICILAEGTTFLHMKGLRSKTEFYLKEFLENKKGIYSEIISTENAVLLGAAIAGLTN